MPAVAGGTGFVGFGDYENANNQASSALAGQVEANNPNLAADQSAVGADTTALGTEVAPWLQTQQNNAVANDQNPASISPGGQPTSIFGDTVTAPGAYVGDTQAQADYLQSEAGNNGAPGHATHNQPANQPDPNNP